MTPPPTLPCFSGVEVLFECGGSYAGTCNTTSGSCVCAPGWSGFTDVVPLDLAPWNGTTLACPVHVNAVKVLWCLNIIPFLMCYYAYPSAFVILRKTWKTQWDHERRLQLMIFADVAIVMPMLFIFHILLLVEKLSVPHDGSASTAIIGVHIPVTVYISIMTFGGIFTGITFQMRAAKAAVASATVLSGRLGSRRDTEDPSSQRPATRAEILGSVYRITLISLSHTPFVDLPLLLSTAFPPEVEDPTLFDVKRGLMVLWLAWNMVANICGASSAIWTGLKIRELFDGLFRFPLDDTVREHLEKTRSAALASQDQIRNQLTIALAIRLIMCPPSWWIIANHYWMPIARLLQMVTMLKMMKSVRASSGNLRVAPSMMPRRRASLALGKMEGASPGSTATNATAEESPTAWEGVTAP